MSLLSKVIEIANKAMNTEASQILDELKAECPKDTGHTAERIKIMGKGENATVSVGGRGLLTNVRIGSTDLSAYYADQGNGGRGRIIRPKEAQALHLKDGSYRAFVHGYNGSHFVARVANRHR